MGKFLEGSWGVFDVKTESLVKQSIVSAFMMLLTAFGLVGSGMLNSDELTNFELYIIVLIFTLIIFGMLYIIFRQSEGIFMIINLMWFTMVMSKETDLINAIGYIILTWLILKIVIEIDKYIEEKKKSKSSKKKQKRRK